MRDFKPAHFNWRSEGDVAAIALKGSERKNPIMFESCAVRPALSTVEY